MPTKVCFINQQANNCTRLQLGAYYTFIPHDCSHYKMKEPYIPIVEEPQFSKASKFSNNSKCKSISTMKYVKRTLSWLWKAFSSSEHLSIIFKMSCQLVVCHIWKIQGVSKKMTWKVALNEKFAQSSSLYHEHNCFEFMPVTSTGLTRTCCHLVDYT